MEAVQLTSCLPDGSCATDLILIKVYTTREKRQNPSNESPQKEQKFQRILHREELKVINTVKRDQLERKP